MFNCNVCEKSIGPRIKPVRVVTKTRAKEYHNEFYVLDEWENRELKKVDSVGSEIVSEVLLCPEDGEKFGLPIHHQKAAKPYVRRFEEPMVREFTQPLVKHMVATALDRTKHNSKRAERDCEKAIPLVKWFVDNNPKFAEQLQ